MDENAKLYDLLEAILQPRDDYFNPGIFMREC